MTPTIKILLASATVLCLGACTSTDPKDLPPGHYASETQSTGASGTGYDTTKSTDVYYDANGNKRATTSTQTTADPPGLFNKHTVNQSTTTE